MIIRKILGLGKDGTLLLKGPHGQEEPVRDQPPPAIGTAFLLLDCSESMEGEKMEQARRGAGEFILKSLVKGYGVGLIAFDDRATVLVPRSRDYRDFEKPLAGLTPGGTTNMTQAFNLALLALMNIEGPRFVVVVTDGTPDTPGTALAAAQKLSLSGVQIITIGTKDADIDFLSGIATARDLAVVVRQSNLQIGIAGTAKSLPLLLPMMPE